MLNVIQRIIARLRKERENKGAPTVLVDLDLSLTWTHEKDNLPSILVDRIAQKISSFCDLVEFTLYASEEEGTLVAPQSGERPETYYFDGELHHLDYSTTEEIGNNSASLVLRARFRDIRELSDCAFQCRSWEFIGERLFRSVFQRPPDGRKLTLSLRSVPLQDLPMKVLVQVLPNEEEAQRLINEVAQRVMEEWF